MFNTLPAYQLNEMSQVLKSIADPARMGILRILSGGERSVTSIHTSAGLPQPTVSRLLSQMRILRLVSARRAGKQVMYSLGSQFHQERDGGVSLELSSGSLSLFSAARSSKTVAA